MTDGDTILNLGLNHTVTITGVTAWTHPGSAEACPLAVLSQWPRSPSQVARACRLQRMFIGF
jgi:hypothetical protein